MSNEQKLSKLWDKFTLLCYRYSNNKNDEYFERMVNTFTKICHTRNIMISKTNVLRVIKAFLEESNDIDDLIEFGDIFNILLIPSELKEINNSLKK